MYGYGYQYGVTILGGSLSTAIFAVYKKRVLADGGTVKNDACTISFLESIGAGTSAVFLLLADDGFLLQENLSNLII
jgi:transketolase N-terminal domain/subunit